MKYILIRDDDLNYFTKFEQIECVYGFMFEQGLSVNFSTIPAVNAAAKTIDRDTGKFIREPFLPAETEGLKGNYPIDKNASLLSKLRSIGSNEYLHHGYEHSQSREGCEFESSDKRLLSEKLDHGREILRRGFGSAPETFVAPQDKYSKEAFELIQKRFNTFSLGWIDRRRLPVTSLHRYVLKKLLRRNRMKLGRLLLTEHPGCHYSQYVKRSVSDKLLDEHISENEVSIIVTHHWEFFNQGKLIVPMWNAFKSRILALQSDRNTKLIKFSQLHSIAQ